MTKAKWKPPVFKNFKSTDLLNAFILNALSTAVIASMTLVFDEALSNVSEKHKWTLSIHLRRFIAFLLAFLSGLICYLVLYFFLGFGGGMIAAKNVQFIN